VDFGSTSSTSASSGCTSASSGCTSASSGCTHASSGCTSESSGWIWLGRPTGCSSRRPISSTDTSVRAPRRSGHHQGIISTVGCRRGSPTNGRCGGGSCLHRLQAAVMGMGHGRAHGVYTYVQRQWSLVGRGSGCAGQVPDGEHRTFYGAAPNVLRTL
jgi:hypothetical protein